jgi:hypothetical protein
LSFFKVGKCNNLLNEKDGKFPDCCFFQIIGRFLEVNGKMGWIGWLILPCDALV